MQIMCVLVAFAGWTITRTAALGPGNPFGIFFGLWLCIAAGLLLARDTFVTPTATIWGMLAVLLLVYLAFAIAAARQARLAPPRIVASDVREPFLIAAQWAVILVVPLFYVRATQLAGGSIASRESYIALRIALTDRAAGYGLLGYLVPLSFVVASIRITQFEIVRTGLTNAVLSLAAASALALLCTGRTFFLMLFCFVGFPLIVTGKIRFRGMTVLAAMLTLSFATVALLTRKGLDIHASFGDNLGNVLKMFRVYLLSPTMAMATMADAPNTASSAWGAYSLRFFHLLFSKLSGYNPSLPPLIRQYVEVPDRVNVFTVMDPYYRDFGMVGVFVFAVVSAAMHFQLYRTMQRRGGPWIFIYSASLFPLVMQFFQDMYLTLLSTWIQVFFWYLLLVAPRPSVAQPAHTPGRGACELANAPVSRTSGTEPT
ncbi:O-antigen polymerase [Cupriavidus pauculus]|uniref:Oligosaccharide repeat unit polymerase n=1 Tax=Cupriavidus pauculus TaxID=82633 RepID=A0A2N5CH80_9BURK|nr:O-antigen polymerase [Cupriavidus pauculus]PLQ01578.1 hypothetical protein CYJ10_07865 [Cupriavidus pauculus]